MSRAAFTWDTLFIVLFFVAVFGYQGCELAWDYLFEEAPGGDR